MIAQLCPLSRIWCCSVSHADKGRVCTHLMHETSIAIAVAKDARLALLKSCLHLNAAIELAGDYVWGVYDLLILPPSFPYGVPSVPDSSENINPPAALINTLHRAQ